MTAWDQLDSHGHEPRHSEKNKVLVQVTSQERKKKVWSNSGKDDIRIRTISANLSPLLLYTVMQESSVLGDGCTGKNSLTVIGWSVWC